MHVFVTRGRKPYSPFVLAMASQKQTARAQRQAQRQGSGRPQPPAANGGGVAAGAAAGMGALQLPLPMANVNQAQYLQAFMAKVSSGEMRKRGAAACIPLGHGRAVTCVAVW